MATDTGRIAAGDRNKAHIYDAPSKTIAALLDNQDLLIAKVSELMTALKGVADQLDLDATVTDTTYGSGNTDALVDDIQVLDLTY